VRPTRLGALAAVLVVMAALSWGVLRVLDSRGQALPPQPWTVPALIGVLAAMVAGSTVALRRRLAGRGGARPASRLGVARMAVLGKASAHAGAALAGVYVGYVVLLLGDLAAGARRERAVVAGLSALAALVLALAGLLLERSCRIRGGHAEDLRPSGGADGPHRDMGGGH
jgi:hypothetical protein